MKPLIKKENVKPLLETRFLNVYDLQYEEGKHYFDASRKPLEQLMAIKSDEEFAKSTPDAVTCVVVLKVGEGNCETASTQGISANQVASSAQTNEPLLLLTKEFRYPAGQFLLSPPAGLLDAEDILAAQKIASDTAHATSNSVGTTAELALLSAARREILEETGIKLKDSDTLKVINPLLFSTPGMTDESNGLALAVVHLDNLDGLTQEGAVGSECFDGFCLLTKAQALDILKEGRDMDGCFYSVYTWAALMYFVTDLWR